MRAVPVWMFTLPLLGGASCPEKVDGCEHDSSERCLWERGVTKPPSDGGADGNGGDGNGDGGAGATEVTELDLALTSMIDIMRAGLEWPLVDARARELCQRRDGEGELVAAAVSPVDEAGSAWSCPVESLELDGQMLELEASSGVIALTAVDLDAERSAALLELARARFVHQCAGSFEEIEGAKLEHFHRCALPEGPYLVVARFPRDLDAGLWQLSIAVVDAG